MEDYDEMIEIENLLSDALADASDVDGHDVRGSREEISDRCDGKKQAQRIARECDEVIACVERRRLRILSVDDQGVGRDGSGLLEHLRHGVDEKVFTDALPARTGVDRKPTEYRRRYAGIPRQLANLFVGKITQSDGVRRQGVVATDPSRNLDVRENPADGSPLLLVLQRSPANVGVELRDAA
jgi:hypothetical protein